MLPEIVEKSFVGVDAHIDPFAGCSDFAEVYANLNLFLRADEGIGPYDLLIFGLPTP